MQPWCTFDDIIKHSIKIKASCCYFFSHSNNMKLNNFNLWLDNKIWENIVIIWYTYLFYNTDIFQKYFISQITLKTIISDFTLSIQLSLVVFLLTIFLHYWYYSKKIFCGNLLNCPSYTHILLLCVIVHFQEFISNNTEFYNTERHGYWTGYRVVEDKWEWTSGRNSTVTSVLIFGMKLINIVVLAWRDTR